MKANDSLWLTTSRTPSFAPLAEDIEVDVAIVGGGITGLTAALLLAEAGSSVALIEARTLGSGVSSGSTAHLTEIIDTRYFDIESDFGAEGARLVAESSRTAIVRINTLAAAYAPASSYSPRPGYLYADRDEDVERLEKEFEAAKRAGLDARLIERAPVPFANKRAMEVADQAQIHVQRYLAGLATGAQAKGARLHEGTRAIAIEDGEPCQVHLENGARVRAKKVILATHSPLNLVFLQTKIAAYRSYVLAFEGVELPNGLFWDMRDPYHYFSSFSIDGHPWLIVGGEDHKTGSVSDTDTRFDSLLRWCRDRFGVDAPARRWSAQVEEPVDGLPFIGRNSASENVYVATGYSGNGITFGTVAAMICADLALGLKNQWADLFAATRMKPVASAATYVSENVDFPYHLITDHLRAPEAKSLDEIAPGDGKTVRVDGQRLAVYRAPDGKLHAVSSVCTHLGCTVKFNSAERTWDCPCHGSRFGLDGGVLDGPAVLGLRPATCEGKKP